MRKIILAILLMLPSVGLWAYNFSANNAAGQTIYYNYVAGGVEVTCPGTANASFAWSGVVKPTGSLVLPSTVTHGDTVYPVVGVGRYAFYGCTGLTSLFLPEGVITIGQAAFSGCIGITTATLPSTLTTLNGTSFYNCTSLQTIVCNAAVPPSATGTTFGNVPATCVVEVPCTSEFAYTNAAQWSSFVIVVSGSCTVALTVSSNDAARGTVTGGGNYQLGVNATIAALPADGYFFGCWNDGDTNNPRIVNLLADTAFTAWFFAIRTDTLTVVDTLTVTDTVHDTIRMTVTYVDTIYVHDTLYDIIRDTLTVVVRDTVLPTFFRLQVQATQGGVGVGSAVVPAGTQMEVCALPLEGYSFTSWDDGSTDNPRQVTVTGNITMTASFTMPQGVDVAPGMSWSTVVEGRSIIVTAANSGELRVFDVQGRRLYDGRIDGGHMALRMPAAGIYLLSVDGSAARKIVVE